MKLIDPRQLPGVRFAFSQYSFTQNVYHELHVLQDTALPPQAYCMKPENERLYVFYGDDAGAMYGVLDAVQKLSNGMVLKEETVTPYVEKRGIKFNVPLDARTPSYSDSSDSARQNIENMWDFSFWQEYLQQMARYKYNVLSLWSLHPFPSMVRVPEYPLVALDDVMVSSVMPYSGLGGREMSNDETRGSLVRVKTISIDEKIDFWRKVMDYARDLCIDIYLFTWNIFTFATELTPYSLPPVMNNEDTKHYFRCSVRAFIETYPQLRGIGITAGELMSRTPSDETWLAETYGMGIADALEKEPERPFTLIHRAHFTDLDTMRDAFAFLPCELEYSFKYSQAHMYSSPKPNFGHKFFEALHAHEKTWLTVRNDDYYMFRWSDPAYAREYLRNMPHEVLKGFYMGADGYTWGRDYLSRNDEHPLVIRRMNDMLRIWGLLAYNLGMPDEEFAAFMHTDYPDVDENSLFEAWSKASSMLGKLACTRWHDMDFQYYPESCCRFDPRTKHPVFCDLEEYVACPAQPGSGHLSVREYCESKKNGSKPEGISPIEVTGLILENAQRVEELLEKLNSQASNRETVAVLRDIRGMTLLGQYNALKIRAAVELLNRRLGLPAEGDGEAYIQQAERLWVTYAKHCQQDYYPQFLTRYQESIVPERFCFQAMLDRYIFQY